MTTAELKKTANEVRKGIIKSTHAAKSGHPGGSLSAADVFTYLYFGVKYCVNISSFSTILRIQKMKTEIVSYYLKDM